jgi:NADPH:quinone reductase-like Zn-dependent oxidoreductase
VKASFFRRFGGPEVLEYGEPPDPAAGEVLVDIHAASVNAADWKMRGGHYVGVRVVIIRCEGDMNRMRKIITTLTPIFLLD